MSTLTHLLRMDMDSMNVLSPFVQFFVGAVALLSAMVTVDRLYHYYVTAYFKWIIRKDPLDDFPATPLPPDMVCGRAYAVSSGASLPATCKRRRPAARTRTCRGFHTLPHVSQTRRTW